VNGTEETLTASEFDLLRVFAEYSNKPFQRDWLLEVTGHREMEPFDRAMTYGSLGCAQDRSRSNPPQFYPHCRGGSAIQSTPKVPTVLAR
jgi:hypothetical protein